MILSKKERAVMSAIYELAHDREAVLLDKEQIMDAVAWSKKIKYRYPDYRRYEPAAKEQTAPEAAEPAPDPAQTPDPAAASEAEQTAPAEPEKARRHRRRRERAAADTAPAAPTVPAPRVYVDPAPYVKGLSIWYKPVRYDELDKILSLLAMLDYFELTEASEGGEIRYVISLTHNGNRWPRDEQDRKKQLAFRLALSCVTPILSFIFGILLRTLF